MLPAGTRKIPGARSGLISKYSLRPFQIRFEYKQADATGGRSQDRLEPGGVFTSQHTGDPRAFKRSSYYMCGAGIVELCQLDEFTFCHYFILFSCTFITAAGVTLCPAVLPVAGTGAILLLYSGSIVLLPQMNWLD